MGPILSIRAVYNMLNSFLHRFKLRPLLQTKYTQIIFFNVTWFWVLLLSLYNTVANKFLVFPLFLEAAFSKLPFSPSLSPISESSTLSLQNLLFPIPALSQAPSCYFLPFFLATKESQEQGVFDGQTFAFSCCQKVNDVKIITKNYKKIKPLDLSFQVYHLRLLLRR